MSTQQDQPLTDTAKKTLVKFLNGYIDASKLRDASLLSATLHPSCTRKIAPSSFLTHLGAPADIVFDNKAYEGQYSKEAPVVGTISADITHTVVQIQPGGLTASARTLYVQRFTDGTDFTLDIAWFLKFSPDGTQITEILEFVDSLGSVQYHKKIEEELAKLEKKD